MDIKDLQGTWVKINSRFPKNNNIEIHENEITFPVSDPCADAVVNKSAEFELCEANYMIHGECCSLKLEGGDYPKPEFYCHMDNVDGKDFPVLSLMTMEYDGRGLIVIATFVLAKDSAFIKPDFESRMYQTCNRRNAPAMMNLNFTSGDMMKFMMSGMNTPQPSKVNAEAWNCACGGQGNTGNFCSECGSPRPAAYDRGTDKNAPEKETEQDDL